ncbi:alpha/beta fold hydrolase [Neorickettsia helminthoeca]|nr:alpha/beta hydrolase [Neorickettsia helminthoeca]
MTSSVVEKRSLKTSLGDIVYLDWNRNSKLSPIICIHGVNRNKHDFDYLAAGLVKNGFRVIALDMLGRGESSYMDRELYTYQTYKVIMLEFIERLNLSRFSLVGTSMGGIISMMVAADMPGYIGTLIINDIGPYTDKSAMLTLSKYLCMYPEFEHLAEAEKFLRVLFKPLNLSEEEHWQHMINSSMRRKENGKYVLNFDPEIFRGHKEKITGSRDLWKVWESIDNSIPILVLRGELSRMLSKETLIQMVQLRPNASYIEYPGIGHAPSLFGDNQIKDVISWLTKNN